MQSSSLYGSYHPELGQLFKQGVLLGRGVWKEGWIDCDGDE